MAMLTQVEVEVDIHTWMNAVNGVSPLSIPIGAARAFTVGPTRRKSRWGEPMQRPKVTTGQRVEVVGIWNTSIEPPMRLMGSVVNMKSGICIKLPGARG